MDHFFFGLLFSAAFLTAAFAFAFDVTFDVARKAVTDKEFAFGFGLAAAVVEEVSEPHLNPLKSISSFGLLISQ